jgi:hypothetical protein
MPARRLPGRLKPSRWPRPSSGVGHRVWRPPPDGSREVHRLRTRSSGHRVCVDRPRINSNSGHDTVSSCVSAGYAAGTSVALLSPWIGGSCNRRAAGGAMHQGPILWQR